MTAFVYLCIILMALIGFLYAVLIGLLTWAWQKHPLVSVPNNRMVEGDYSILIPVRNEEDHLGSCLESLIKQDYPGNKYEIIVIDDHSEDYTNQIAKSFAYNVKTFSLVDGEGKKRAIELGVEKAAYEKIVCIDGDCVYGMDWLKTIDFHFIEDLQFITGPVKIVGPSTIIANFQVLDNLASMALTYFGIHKKLFYMSNGANMSFLRSTFYMQGGFGGNEKISSGDDVFLSKKVGQANPNKVTFIKNQSSFAKTKHISSVKKLVSQRLRWASKTTSYVSNKLLIIQGIIFLGNMAFIIGGLLGVFIELLFLWFCFVKVLVDFALLWVMAGHFGQKYALKSFIPMSLLYPFYFLFMACASLFKIRSQWKGREVSV